MCGCERACLPRQGAWLSTFTKNFFALTLYLFTGRKVVLKPPLQTFRLTHATWRWMAPRFASRSAAAPPSAALPWMFPWWPHTCGEMSRRRAAES